MIEVSKAIPNILLVEDNGTDVKIIKNAFSKEHFACVFHTVSDGEDALEYIQNKGKYSDKIQYSRPDIIVLDVILPKMDGYAFVQKLKTLKGVKDIPVIIFTAKEGMEDLFQIEGVDEYVVKSVDALDLMSRISEMLS